MYKLLSLTNENIILDKNDTYKLIVDCDKAIELVINENINCDILIEIKENVKHFKLNLALKDFSEVHYLLLNNATVCEVEENLQLAKGAYLYNGYGSLTRENGSYHALYELNGEDSRLESRYTFICDDEDNKQNVIDIKHHKGQTYANVELYGVVKKTSKLSATINGYIDKGAKGAITHQASRCLTFDKNVNAKIEPVLYIDENDVQASHACSLGSVDENHLYYLQSRGLTRKDAVNLIVSGYLSVLDSVFDKDALKEEVNNILLEKAGA